MLFNPDMDARLFDLHTALSKGGAITAEHHAAFHGQPDRLLVDIVGTDRRLVFDLPAASALADHLTANGLEDAAGVIRTRIQA